MAGSAAYSLAVAAAQKNGGVPVSLDPNAGIYSNLLKLSQVAGENPFTQTVAGTNMSLAQLAALPPAQQTQISNAADTSGGLTTGLGNFAMHLLPIVAAPLAAASIAADAGAAGSAAGSDLGAIDAAQFGTAAAPVSIGGAGVTGAGTALGAGLGGSSLADPALAQLAGQGTALGGGLGAQAIADPALAQLGGTAALGGTGTLGAAGAGSLGVGLDGTTGGLSGSALSDSISSELGGGASTLTGQVGTNSALLNSLGLGGLAASTPLGSVVDGLGNIGSAASGLGSLGSSLGSLLGGTGGLSSLLGSLGSVAGSTLPGLLALNYASNQPGVNLTNLNGVMSQLQGNQNALVTAAQQPLQQTQAAGYGQLVQSQAARGIYGSSFGDTDLGNYLNTTGAGIANAGANAAQGSLSLQGNLASQIAQLQQQNQTQQNNLYGSAFNILGRGLNPTAYAGASTL